MKNSQIRAIVREKLMENKNVILIYCLAIGLMSLLPIAQIAMVLMLPVMNYVACKAVFSGETFTFSESTKDMSLSFMFKNLFVPVISGVLGFLFMMFSLIITTTSIAFSGGNVSPEMAFFSPALIIGFLIFLTLLIVIRYMCAGIPYVSYSYQDLGFGDTLKMSKKIMKGHWFDMFVFDIYFFFMNLIASLLGVVIIVLIPLVGIIIFLTLVYLVQMYSIGAIALYVKELEKETINYD